MDMLFASQALSCSLQFVPYKFYFTKLSFLNLPTKVWKVIQYHLTRLESTSNFWYWTLLMKNFEMVPFKFSVHGKMSTVVGVVVRVDRFAIVWLAKSKPGASIWSSVFTTAEAIRLPMMSYLLLCLRDWHCIHLPLFVNFDLMSKIWISKCTNMPTIARVRNPEMTPMGVQCFGPLDMFLPGVSMSLSVSCPVLLALWTIPWVSFQE